MNFRYGNMPHTLLEYDMELKRERSELYPEFVVYPYGKNSIRVLNEETGVSSIHFREGAASPFASREKEYQVASNYFRRHAYIPVGALAMCVPWFSTWHGSSGVPDVFRKVSETAFAVVSDTSNPPMLYNTVFFQSTQPFEHSPAYLED